VVAIDIGAGTTTVASFARGHLLSTDVVPVGGNHATFDLAHALGAPAHEAERIKKEYGTLARVVSDDHEVIEYAQAGQAAGGRAQTTKGEVRTIIRGRMLRLFGHLAGRIERSGVAQHTMQRMVLTGGGSQVVGSGEFAADFFARPVRVARSRAAGMPAGLGGRRSPRRLACCRLRSIPAQARAGIGEASQAIFAAYGTVAPGRILRAGE
jgi:cell division protein FtsA